MAQAALLDEVGTLLERADELAGLLDQLEVPLDGDPPLRFLAPRDEGEAEIDDAEMGLSAERAT